MIRTANLARRTSITVVMAGAVAFGAVALAPAASAATSADVDGSYEIVEKTNGKGPAAFLITENGRTPIFFCDEDKPNKRHNNCQADPEGGDGRF
jgi:hypothetical protein